MASSFTKTDLFGGAISANIPNGFADVSNIRQVPDHQEVYLSATGFSSIIFDIAERVSHLPNDQEALVFHFNDIVNPGDESRVWRSSAVQPDNLPLVSKSTDLVITINLPHIPTEEDTNATSTASSERPEEIDFENGRFGSFVEDGLRARDELLRTLTIHDWNLFGEDHQSAVNGMQE